MPECISVKVACATRLRNAFGSASGNASSHTMRTEVEAGPLAVRSCMRARCVFASVPGFCAVPARAARAACPDQHMPPGWVYAASNARGVRCTRGSIRSQRRASFALAAAPRRVRGRRTRNPEQETAMALDERQRHALLQQLNECEQALRAELRASEDQRASESYAELAGASPDEGDEANADLFVDVDHALIGMKLAELRAIRRAQQRMVDGSYGDCIDCDGPVGYARLRARPTAERCTHCQALYERRYATAPRASL
ncbi:transcriptional regulator, TraR/DksA family [Burkholderia multivorans ATCC 17616]|nr:transcriptional regulator, TraR/DksA family [Burkholderia multivorans ATCC 17616]